MTEAVAAEDVQRSPRWASRKLWFCASLLALATWLLWQGKLGEASWLSVAGTTAWAYISGNVGQVAADSLAKIVAAFRGNAAP